MLCASIDYIRLDATIAYPQCRKFNCAKTKISCKYHRFNYSGKKEKKILTYEVQMKYEKMK